VVHQVKKGLIGVAALTALALGGSAIADAASSSSSSSTTTTSSSSTQAPPAFKGPAHGTSAHEDAEKPVTGAAADKAKAAAVKAAGGGTAGAVTTDYTQNGYEVTVKNADGSEVEVHLDSSFTVLQGPGGRGAHGPAGGPPPPAGTYQG
jgi:hypothetical protein